MNKKEIKLHYLPCIICGIDILGFYHSTKSTATQKCWLIFVGVVLDMAWDGRPPPILASSARNRCSSHNSALGWCQPLGGARARCSHGAVRAQSVAHSE